MSSYENEAPSGDVVDNSYVSRSGHKNEPLNVVSDQERIEEPIDAGKADTDEQLGKCINLIGFFFVSSHATGILTY